MAKNVTTAEKPQQKQMTVAEQRQVHLAQVRDALDKGEAEFAKALPDNIPPDRFKRVVLTAVQSNLDLLNCDRASLFRSAIKAAQDGLLPDGREGALVPYQGQVQWMPMVLGLRKKARNSGKILDWDVQIVRERDDFEFELGDEAFIRHRPYLGRENPGEVIAAYSIAHLKDGGTSREVMSRHDIDKVRKASKSSKGPWFDWFEEMARKTVARRHSKSLPMSSDLDDLVRSDDYLYDKDGAAEENKRPAGRSVRGNLAMLAGGIDRQPPTIDAAPEDPPHDPETGEIDGQRDDGQRGDVGDEQRQEADKGRAEDGDDFPGDKPAGTKAAKATQTEPDPTPEQLAFRRGADARAKGILKRGSPPEFRERGSEKLLEAWQSGWESLGPKEGDDR